MTTVAPAAVEVRELVFQVEGRGRWTVDEDCDHLAIEFLYEEDPNGAGCHTCTERAYLPQMGYNGTHPTTLTQEVPMSEIDIDANDFLMSAGVKSASFASIGDSVTGFIASKPEVQHQTDFETSEPLYWKDGKPRLQLKVILQTEDRDPEDQDDDGQRAVYIKGNMQQAVSKAVRAAKAGGLAVGGKLRIKYVANGAGQRGKNPPKLYEALYRAPEPESVPLPEPDGEAPAERMARGEKPVRDVAADEIPF